MLVTIVVKAQTLSHYFSRDIPVRHLLNPAFQPESRYYISLPVIGNADFSYHNNSYSLKDAVEKDLNGFYSTLQPNNLITVNSRINLLSAGLGIYNTYLSFNISQRANAHINLPSDLYKMLIYGTPDKYENTYNLNFTGFSGELFTETALGISQQLNEQWTVGMKLKLLTGNTVINFFADNITIKGGIDNWNLKGASLFGYAGAINQGTDKITDLQNIKFPAAVTDWLKPNGAGAGIDLGVHFRMLQDFYLSASVTDLGFIKWRKNVISNKLSTDFSFDGFVQLNSSMSKDELSSAFSNFNTVSNTLDSLMNDLKTNVHNLTYSSFSTRTNPAVNIAAEYRFLSDKISTGLIYNTVFYPGTFANRLTAILNYKPFEQLNATLSYSFLSGYNSLGAGLNFKIGIVRFFSYFDVVNMNFARIKSSDFTIPFPYSKQSFNFSAGINIAFGKREKISDYPTNQRFNPRTGLYKPKFKKDIFNWYEQ